MTKVKKCSIWYVTIVVVFALGVLVSPQDKNILKQAYLEGYRVGWSHGIWGHPSQLGQTRNQKWAGIGKECLYEDRAFVSKYLKIFKYGRCPK